MENLVCSNCNAPLDVKNKITRTVTCQYCGSSYLVPGAESLPSAGEATSLADDSSQQTGTYCRGTAPQPVITELAPLPPECVQREATDVASRTLILTGEYFPVIYHGLQFSRVDDSRLSLIFDMEVNWESPTRITVDIARIKHALWNDACLRLRVRLMDSENCNYQPQSDWSPEFILADNDAAC